MHLIIDFIKWFPGYFFGEVFLMGIVLIVLYLVWWRSIIFKGVFYLFYMMDKKYNEKYFFEEYIAKYKGVKADLFGFFNSLLFLGVLCFAIDYFFL